MNEFADTFRKFGVRTEVFSNKCLIIEGCDCIIDGQKDEFIVKSGRMKINIKGKNLNLTKLTESSLCLSGSVHSISFIY